MNRYYVQAEMGISKTVTAKSADNARKNFLAKMEKDHPDLYEFIKDNVNVTCIYVDPNPNQSAEGEKEGWVDEFDRHIPTEEELREEELYKLTVKRGLGGLPRSYDDEK